MARVKEFDEAEVLERAIRLFSQKGYHGISMQDLVDGLKINRSSIYDTFGDKESLFLAALQHYRQGYTQKMVDMLENTSDVKATLKEIFDYISKDNITEQTKFGCMMVNTVPELPTLPKKINGVVNENMEAVQAALTNAFKRAQKENTISKKHSPAALAHFVANTINGLRLANHLSNDKKMHEDVMNLTLSMFEK